MNAWNIAISTAVSTVGPRRRRTSGARGSGQALPIWSSQHVKFGKEDCVFLGWSRQRARSSGIGAGRASDTATDRRGDRPANGGRGCANARVRTRRRARGNLPASTRRRPGSPPHAAPPERGVPSLRVISGISGLENMFNRRAHDFVGAVAKRTIALPEGVTERAFDRDELTVDGVIADRPGQQADGRRRGDQGEPPGRPSQ